MGARYKGFTLVELLVVVAIIALLVTILMPSLTRAKELARRVKCATNLGILGRAWRMYWTDSGGRHPPMILGNRPGSPNLDSISHFNDRICGSWGNWTGVGFLWTGKYVSDERVYACPTYETNAGAPWFWGPDESPSFPGNGGPTGGRGGPWPPDNRRGNTRTTYGLRRMKNYDDRILAGVDEWWQSDPRTDDIMLQKCGVDGIADASGFSFMADNFRCPKAAILSHVPGVNVQFLDSHVEYWEDPTRDGSVLYNNGIVLPSLDAWDDAWNWLHDDIWMIIDGYHQPPVGQ